MKIRLLLFFVLIIDISSFGQTSIYHPFPDSGAVWVMRHEDWCLNIPCYAGCTASYQYRVSGDTLIYGNVYKKIFKEGYYANCYCDMMNVPHCGTYPFFSEFFLGIRDDSLNKKVFLNDGNSPEELLLDFNLTVGDTLTSRYCSDIIAGIDSALVGNLYRKRFLTSSAREIVEGIGDVSYTYSGPFDACGCVCSQLWSFSCFMQNGNVIYGDSNCSLVSTVQNITEDDNLFHLFPNPATNELQIQNAGIRIESIEIYDMLGQLQMTGADALRNTSGRKSQNFSVNISRLFPGIYFLCVENGKERIVRKFIKQ